MEQYNGFLQPFCQVFHNTHISGPSLDELAIATTKRIADLSKSCSEHLRKLLLAPSSIRQGFPSVCKSTSQPAAEPARRASCAVAS